MRITPPAMPRSVVGLLALLAATACAKDPLPIASAAEGASGCLAAGDGNLKAEVRGAVVADLDWRNAQMQCDGGMRPDGQGLRITIAGPLPQEAGAEPRKLRFIFGIGLVDSAGGAAQVLPTNLTVIVEGAQQLYATRGDDRCAVESLRRTPLAGVAGTERVEVRGYCTSPAAEMAGDAQVLVPTFNFTALLRNGTSP